MILFESRLSRESIVIEAMIRKYCKAHHYNSKALCEKCTNLLDYSNLRLEKCKFGNQKPICKKCKVHCYSPEKRDSIKKIMRWSGPRMIYSHPLYALIHFLDRLAAK